MNVDKVSPAKKLSGTDRLLRSLPEHYANFRNATISTLKRPFRFLRKAHVVLFGTSQAKVLSIEMDFCVVSSIALSQPVEPAETTVKKTKPEPPTRRMPVSRDKGKPIVTPSVSQAELDHYDALTGLRDRLAALRCAICGASINDVNERSGLQRFASDLIENLDAVREAFVDHDLRES